MYSVVDLFSGAGGMSYGFASLPRYFRIQAAFDAQRGKPGRGKSPASITRCNLTYERNIGIAPIETDLAKLPPVDLRRAAGLEQGELSVLISCAPCTGFSQKNAANHVTDDPRNSLVQRTGLYVEELMPKILVMENVKELLNGNQRHHFANLQSHLSRLGYTVSADVHDLADFGLPQHRKRALVIASREDMIEPPAADRTRYKTVRDAIAHLPRIDAGDTDADDAMHRSPGLTDRVRRRLQAIPADGGSWADVMNDPNLTLDDKRELLVPAMFRARPGSFPDVYGRLKWDRPCVTITRECGHVGNGRYVHPEQDRLLTVREMALLQGFPADYEFLGPMSAKYNQIGDAVPPMVSELIAWHLLQHLNPLNFLENASATIYSGLAKLTDFHQMF